MAPLFTGLKLGFGRSAEDGGAPFSATGGTITTPGNGYKYHFFISPAAPETFEVSGAAGSIDIFLVAGGGGGGWSGGNTPGSGGGGAGGLVELTSQVISVGTYPVTVGDGGAGGGPGSYNSAPEQQLSGTNTVFNSIVAYGGGRGEAHPQSGFRAETGGSGGGSMQSHEIGYGVNPGTPQGFLDPLSPPATAPYPITQGAPGGLGPDQGGGGGGGAGNGTVGPGDGGTGDPGDGPGNAGDGGHGRVAFSGDTGIPASYGTSGPAPGRYFAGGGGGAGYSGRLMGAAPPFGGGGAGGPDGSSGQANTGGGGGGGKSSGGSGANGIVIIRYVV
jgi:hypothetical protein